MSAELNGMDSVSDRDYACEAEKVVKLKFGQYVAVCLTLLLWHFVCHTLRDRHIYHLNSKGPYSIAINSIG